eukprot:s270_g7.t1
MAVTTHEHIFLDNVLRVADCYDMCLGPAATHQCQAWIATYPLLPGIPFMGRSGYSISGQYRRRDPLPAFQGPVLLQLSQHLIRPGFAQERLIDETVAPARQPCRTIPPLDQAEVSELTSTPSDTSSVHILVRIWTFPQDPSESSELLPPEYVELPKDFTPALVEQELRCWGFRGQAYPCGSHEAVLFVPASHSHRDLYFYCNSDPSCAAGVFAHFGRAGSDDLAHMRVLHARGFKKAIVLLREELTDQVTCLHFQDVQPQGPPMSRDIRQRSPRPPPQSVSISREPAFDLAAAVSPLPSCHLAMNRDALRALFTSGSFFLLQDLSDFALPDFICDALQQCRPVQRTDRYVIYTDGSSQSRHRHRPPLWVEEHDVSDTWCFAVFREQYCDPQDDALPWMEFVGLSCQPVLYEPDRTHFAGTTHIGSDAAETEALLWSALWRLAQNDHLPTAFVSDSQLAGGQAQGILGSTSMTKPFQHLRAAFQALEALLPDDQLLVTHTRSHAGDPFNELVDHFAKLEGQKSLYLPRQPVDLLQLGPSLAHLWMLLASTDDVPKFAGEGFDLSAPALPSSCSASSSIPAESTTMASHLTRFHLSMGTANVCTFYKGDEGTAGKIAYVREQFRSHGLHFLGLQETRTPQGHHGVELWVNLRQPFAYQTTQPLYFSAGDFVVVAAGPRYLFVHVINAYIDLWLVVAYAPQSGQTSEQREAWWQDFDVLFHQYVSADRAIVMIDANAASGSSDHVHIFEKDDRDSVNTALFRAFLQQHAFCAPATSALHSGPMTTWISPIDDSEHRIDYVLIPCSWRSRCTTSCSLSALDLCTIGDHIGVAAEIAWTDFLSTNMPAQRPQSSLSFDRQRISMASLHATEPLQKVLALPWQTDIETQVDVFNSNMLHMLSTSCGKAAAKPKKPFFDGKVWQLRADKLKLGRRIRELRRVSRLELLATVFQAWKRPGEAPVPLGTSFSTSLRCRLLHLQVQYGLVHQRLRHDLRQARATALSAAVEALPLGCDASNILHKLKPILGSTNHKKVKAPPLPMVNDAQGVPCATPEAARNRWIEFFGAMEGGTRMQWEELRSTWLSNLRDFTMTQVSLAADEVPSLVHLEQAFRRVRAGKAVGADFIPPELCHHHPALLARLVYTQMLKLLTHGHEALLHKGGLLVAAWKKKSSQAECSSYRSLLISSHVGKTIHRAVRDSQSALYEQFLHGSQIGGRKKVPVAIGLHHVRTSLRRAHCRGCSSSLVFLDLQEAFYRVLRPLAVGGRIDDGALAQLSARLHLPSDALHDLHRLLQQPAATEQACLPGHLRRTLLALHTDTHFHVQGQQDFVRTEIGTRPGDPFADVVFGYLFSRLLRCVDDELRQHDLLEEFQVRHSRGLFGQVVDGASTQILGPTWMDDLCLTLSASSATALESKTALACSILLDACYAHGVTPNVQKGKTEILFAFRGQGSRALKTRHFGPSSPKTMPIVTERGTLHISIVGHYIHLGGQAHHTSHTVQEMRPRLAQGHAAFNQHRRSLFQNPGLPLRRRCELLQSLVLSKIVYGMETWVMTDQASQKYFHSAILRLYRRVLKLAPTDTSSDDAILPQLELPAPNTLLRLARLRYVSLLYNCEHVTPWPVFCEDETWLSLVRQDLSWVWQLLEATVKLRDPLSHFEDWEYIFRYHRSYWKTLLRRASYLEMLHTCDRHALVSMHRRIFDHLSEVGTFKHPLVTLQPEPKDEDCVFGCMYCGKRCKTRGGEGAHLFRVHGIVARERWLYDTTSCPGCLKEYHTFAKLQAHLRYSQRCREQARGRVRVSTPAPGMGSVLNAELRRAHDRLLPVLPGQGPHDLRRAPQEDEDYRLELFEAMALRVFDQPDMPHQALYEGLATLILHCAIGWTETKQTLRHLQVSFDHEDLTRAGLSLNEWEAVLGRLLDYRSWPFLCDDTGLERTHHHLDLRGYHDWCANLSTSEESYRLGCRCPRVRFRERVVIHAFSGRRRPGDLQWFMEKFADQRHVDFLSVVSLDLVIDEQWGDLGRRATYDFWLTAIKSGYVLGFLGGPPCCTWSIARGKSFATSHRQRQAGPRIIRTLADLWGLQSLSIREKRQIMDGNFLLGFCIEALVLLYVVGGAGVLEHPAEPDEEEAASIWRLPVLQFMSSLPGFQQFTLAQGLLGADSTKSTGLLTLNLPELPRFIRAQAVTPNLPFGQSIGLNADGRLFVCTEFFRLPNDLRRGAHLCLTPSCSEPFGYVDVEFGLLAVPSVGCAIGGLGKMPGVYFRQQNADSPQMLLEAFYCAIDHALDLPEPQYWQMAKAGTKATFPFIIWRENLLEAYHLALTHFKDRWSEKDTDRLNHLWAQVAGREGVQRELAHRENNRFRRMSSTSIAARR